MIEYTNEEMLLEYEKKLHNMRARLRAMEKSKNEWKNKYDNLKKLSTCSKVDLINKIAELNKKIKEME